MENLEEKKPRTWIKGFANASQHPITVSWADGPGTEKDYIVPGYHGIGTGQLVVTLVIPWWWNEAWSSQRGMKITGHNTIIYMWQGGNFERPRYKYDAPPTKWDDGIEFSQNGAELILLLGMPRQ